MRIGELAAATGVEVETIRYYEPCCRRPPDTPTAIEPMARPSLNGWPSFVIAVPSTYPSRTSDGCSDSRNAPAKTVATLTI